jgi:alpha-mannosidase
MITVHLIGNAHIDPAWLWTRHAGVDTVLATARSACDRLDEYPDFVFTCSAAWFYRMVMLNDYDLFERIQAFAADGRWQAVGGMYIQPDCNLPLAESFAQQLSAGQGFYEDVLGGPTTVGYNVDSFGHTAYLPRFLNEAGIDSYVFMRPGPHEKELPARLFRWRSPDGHEVTAFRIAGAYTTGAKDLGEQIRQSLTDLPPGCEHTMCFFGVGDHGGGPTKAQIEWIIEHRDAFEGARLAFSHPAAFFEAVGPLTGDLPAVEGELQHHAIGCYSVERRIKVSMRRAESRLTQAAQISDMFPDAATELNAWAVNNRWLEVLFNQFHDILGGTCIDRAGRHAAGQLVNAEAVAEDVTTEITRSAFRDAAEPGVHKIVVVNADEAPFDGWIEHEPWCGGRPAGVPRLIGEDGAGVPVQVIRSAAKVPGLPRLLFRLQVAAETSMTLRLEEEGGSRWFDVGEERERIRPVPEGAMLLGNDAIALSADREAIELGGWVLSLDVHDDPTDTWAHGPEHRFAGELLGRFSADGGWTQVESGPLRDAVTRPVSFGNSRAWLRLALARDESVVRLRLRVVWAEARRRLVLRMAAPAGLDARTDLVSGGPLDRPLDGLEYPLSGGLFVSGGDTALGVAAPEVFSVSAGPDGAAFTLVRSPFMAHHDPMPADLRPDAPVTDQGYHEIDLVLMPGCADGVDAVEREARAMLNPPMVWDLTG